MFSTKVNLNDKMIESGIQFIKNNSKTKSFLSHWADLTVENNYSLVNDNGFGLQEHPEFIEHRHDQSIFTLLMRKENMGIVLKNDSHHSQLWEHNLYDIQAPIVAFRNISNLSKLSTMEPVYIFQDKVFKINL
jgi:hypothetical protein